MDSKEKEPNGERLFQRLHLDEHARKELAELARMGAAAQGVTRTITFIAAQSDTLTSAPQEKENA